MRVADGRIELEPAPLEVRLERERACWSRSHPPGSDDARVRGGASHRVRQGAPSGARTQAAMRRFLPDTSCLVAAVCWWHENHAATAQELARRARPREEMVMAAPALVEAYAVLTRLPPPVPPATTGRTGGDDRELEERWRSWPWPGRRRGPS